MKFLFLVFCFFLFMSFKYRHFNNPFKLYIVIGKKGSGKSSFLCKVAKTYLKKGFSVYTNMSDCTLPGIRLIDASKLGEFVPPKKSCVLLDECGILFDNRNFKSFRSDTRDFFKLQRHYECVVYLASQSLDVDKKLRDLADCLFLVNNLFNWLSLVRPIRKRISLVEASAMGESRIADNLRFAWFPSWRFLVLPRYSRFFDSFVAPEKPPLPYDLPVSSPDKRKNTKKFFYQSAPRA